MPDLFSLAGKVALITGASRGLGWAIAEALAEHGAHVVLTSRDQAALDDRAAELEKRGQNAQALAFDAADRAAGAAAVAAVHGEHGRLDILVNNAGYGLFSPLVDTSFEDFQGIYRTNVFGPFLMSREAARQFIKQGSGELINISSTSSLKGSAGRTEYGSSKFALRGRTECWRDELRRHNVRVMLVNPSEVMTDFAAKAGVEREPSDKKLRPEEIADAILGALKVDSRGFIPEFSVFATNPF